MPYRIRWEGHGVYRRFFGVVTLKEIRDAYEEMIRDVRFEGMRYIISDFLEATADDAFSEAALRPYAETERLRYYDSPDTVHAMVATDPKALRYVRYYQSMRISPYCMKDFRTVAEARHWIAGHPRLGWNPPSP
jgi:hypothetical protein